MGQQISAGAEGSGSGASPGGPSTHSSAAAADGKTKGENGEAGRMQAPAWKNVNSLAAVVLPRGETAASGPGDGAKLGSKAENEVSRMSIRAAIDTFIENCLSASNDVSPSADDRGNDDSPPPSNPMTYNLLESINTDARRTKEDSQNSQHSESSKDSVNSRSASVEEAGKSGKVNDNNDDDDEKDDDKELIIDCDEKSGSDPEIKVETKDGVLDSINLDRCHGTVKKEVKLETVKKEVKMEVEVKDIKVEQGIDIKKENSPCPPPLPGADKSAKSSPSGEKQTFSEYLQDRLKTGGYDKQEELAQLAQNKDIRSHGQMLMWEMARKPVPAADASNVASAQSNATAFPSGPVRLQTLIDKVLDNSLNNQDLRPGSGASVSKKKKEVGCIPQERDQDSPKTDSPSGADPSEPSPIGASPKEKEESDSLKEEKSETETKPKKSTLCFKDHIEKVLLESFLSYEEEEKREALKNKGDKTAEGIKPRVVETDSERMNAKKEGAKVSSDGTISVQDIVDRVISQTEVISKLLTPSGAEAGKGSSSAHKDGTSASGGSSNQALSALKYQNMSPQGKALIDAQRHTVQREHQTSATMGRKRGRPRLGSPMNSSTTGNWSGGDPPKDMKSGYHDHRLRDHKTSSQISHGAAHPSEPSRGSNSSLHGHPRPGQGPPPLDYAPRGSIQYGIPAGLSSLMTSHNTAPPSSAMFQSRHHLVQQQQQRQQQQQQHQHPQETSPSAKASQPMSTASVSSYHQSPLDSYHHRAGHLLPGQAQQQQQQQQHLHRSQQHPGHPASAKPLPPLILSDQLKDGLPGAGGGSGGASRLVPVSHIPTKSCSCHSCVAHFSREKSPSHASHSHLPQHMRHPPGKPDGRGEPSQHPSHYHPYQTSSPRRSSKDYYPQTIPPSTEALRPVVAVPGQGLPPQAIIPSFVAAQRQRQDAGQPPPSRDVPPSSRYYDPKGRNPSPGHYPPYQTHPSQPGIPKPSHPDARFAEPDRHMPPRHPAMPEHSLDGDPSKRGAPPRDKVPPHPHAHESVAKVGGSPHAPPPSAAAPAGHEGVDQPLDLSVKPSPAHRRDTRNSFEHNSDHSATRQEPGYPDNRQAYRRSSLELSQRGPGAPGGQGQYVEYEQGGQGGHHLQRLENSVGRFLPQNQPHSQPQMPLYAPHPHHHQQQQQQQQHHHQHQLQQQQQQRARLSPLQGRPDARAGPAGAPTQQDRERHHQMQQHIPRQESPGHRGQPALHRSRSPVSYPHPMSNPSPSHHHHHQQQQQQQPQQLLPQSQHHRSVAPSPGSHGYQDRRSPSIGHNHHGQRSSGASPHHQQQPYPGTSSGQIRPRSATSPSGFQRPPSHGQEHDARGTPGSGATLAVPQIHGASVPGHPPSHPSPAPPHPHAPSPSHPHNMSVPSHSSPLPPPHSSPAPPGHPVSAPPPHSLNGSTGLPHSQSTPSLPHPESTPSPDDQDPQRLNVSKHEPIQNIIGNHPQSDILYLICRLCRQTYGSPYGFRKHFRNQHGFEPKAEHTIVQTISATKTAMAHTGPLDVADKPQSPKDEKSYQEEAYIIRQVPLDGCVPPSSQAASAPRTATPPADDIKTGAKKDLPENTKFLECPECGQTFQLNDFGSYKRHCRQHSLHRSSGPFACHDCQRSFAEPGQLQEHLVTHSTFTPSVCGICRTFFSSPTYLAGHLQAAHGHVYNSDSGDKSSDNGDSSRRSSDDQADKSESSMLSIEQGQDSEIKRSSSFSGVSSSGSGHPSQQIPEQQRSSSMSVSKDHVLPISKRHRLNLSSAAADSQLFTVHTPKGLEVQKLPADAVVTTASPDSSYDEAKFYLESQPGNSGSQKAVTPAEASSSGETETSKDGRGQGDSSSSSQENNSGNVIINLPKQSDLSQQNKSGVKDDTESNCSDRCPSAESNSMSVEGSRSASPGIEEAERFYKHKKYSRHRKRVSSSEVGSEHDAKAQKMEISTSSSSQRQDQSPYSVSSTANSGVTFRDCESSCLHSEDSNSSSTKSKGDDGKQHDEKVNNKHGASHKDERPETRSKRSEPVLEDGKSGSGSKKVNSGDVRDGGTKFKWDRQTRSQAGKGSHSVSYTSS